MLTKNKQGILRKEDILAEFSNACKSETDFKIGIEYERLGVNINNTAISYKKAVDFIKSFKEENDEFIFEGENIIGLLTDDYSLTLEPGSQVEVSINPQKEVSQIAEKLTAYTQKADKLAGELGFRFINKGIQPLTTYKDIDLIPKERYKIMAEYLPYKGDLASVMMRETAGVQVAFDYSSEKDAISKLRLALKLSPIMQAMYANSSFRGGRETGYKSFRAYSWLNTDENRCGMISKKLFENDFGFEEYIEEVFDIPMIFIKRQDTYIKTDNLTFGDFLKNGYAGLEATMEDWKLHLNLFFPEVRMQNYLEIRNHDSNDLDKVLEMASIWEKILYNKSNFSYIENILSDIKWKEVNTMRNLAPKYGLETTIKNKSLNYYSEILYSLNL